MIPGGVEVKKIASIRLILESKFGDDSLECKLMGI